jgi:hypothetical protein
MQTDIPALAVFLVSVDQDRFARPDLVCVRRPGGRVAHGWLA